MDRAIAYIIYFEFALLIAVFLGRLAGKLSQRYLTKPGSLLCRVFFKDWESTKTDRQGTSNTPISRFKKLKYYLNKSVPVLLGLGLVLLPYIHYQVIYILGYFLIVTATLIGIVLGNISFGPKWVWIPLLIITVSGIILSEMPNQQPASLLLVWFFGMYLVSRKAGSGITRFFGLATVVGCIGIIVYSVTHNFVRTGGLIHPGNYNIATAAIVTGFLLWDSKYKWALSALVLVALFFTGANEALVAVAALGLVLLIRRDWSKRLLLPVGALILVLAVCTPLGITQKVWSVTSTRIEAGASTIELPSQPSEEPILDASLDTATGSRWSVYKKAFAELKIIGHGYAPFDDLGTSIHNVPLRIAYELGIPITIVWLIVYFYALRKSKAKYALVALGAFSLFDNMFWTQIPAYFWVGLGVCLTASTPDYLFRESTEQSTSKSVAAAAVQSA